MTCVCVCVRVFVRIEYLSLIFFFFTVEWTLFCPIITTCYFLISNTFFRLYIRYEFPYGVHVETSILPFPLKIIEHKYTMHKIIIIIIPILYFIFQLLSLTSYGMTSPRKHTTLSNTNLLTLFKNPRNSLASFLAI